MFCQYVVLFVAVASVRRVTCDQPAVIAHVDSEYVLDGRTPFVRLQPFIGSDSQYWTKEPAGDGKYYIINKQTGGVLDIKYTSEGNYVITSGQLYPDQKYRQWFINSDDTIVNALANNDLAVDIPDNDVKPGVRVIAYPKNGRSNQKFRFENRTVEYA